MTPSAGRAFQLMNFFRLASKRHRCVRNAVGQLWLRAENGVVWHCSAGRSTLDATLRPKFIKQAMIKSFQIIMFSARRSKMHCGRLFGTVDLLPALGCPSPCSQLFPQLGTALRLQIWASQARRDWYETWEINRSICIYHLLRNAVCSFRR